MEYMDEKATIDQCNTIEREINGCMVRLFFGVERNSEIERMVVCRLLELFDRRMQEKTNVQP